MKSQAGAFLIQWKTWLEGRGIRFEKATGADALEWLRGFEPQVTAGLRVFSVIAIL